MKTNEDAATTSAGTAPRNDRKVLFELADGPEGITIYESTEEGIVDWANHLPALYVTVAIDGASSKFGPFKLLKWRASSPTEPAAEAPAPDPEREHANPATLLRAPRKLNKDAAAPEAGRAREQFAEEHVIEKMLADVGRKHEFDCGDGLTDVRCDVCASVIVARAYAASVLAQAQAIRDELRRLNAGGKHD